MERFLGMPYPIEATPKGYLPTISGNDTIKADLLILLLTNPGERIMMPTYGTPLRRLVFEPNDSFLEEQAREMITESIRMWEPRIAIDAIEVRSKVDSDFLVAEDDGNEKEKVLGIKILFRDPHEISEIEELVLEVPLN